jgi:exopolysaccharide biosynthesis polyprenyl glycosylphosphotransferase
VSSRSSDGEPRIALRFGDRIDGDVDSNHTVFDGSPWRNRPDLWLRAFGDLLVVGLAFFVSYELYTGLIGIDLLPRLTPPRNQYMALASLFGAGVVSFGLLTGAYGSATSVLQYRETRGAVNAVWLTAAFLFAAFFILKAGSEFSRLLLSTAVLLAAILIILARRATAPLLSALRQTGNLSRRVVIAGSGQTARLLMKKIVQAPTAGLSLVGFIDDYVPLNTPISCRMRQGAPERFSSNVLGRTWDLAEVHRNHGVQLLLLALSDISREAVDTVVQAAEDLGIEVGLVPRLGDLRADQLELQDLTAIPLLLRSPVRLSSAGQALKRALDLIVTVPLLILSLPIWMIAYLAIRIDSPGPVLFRQVRVGRGGAAFVILKFRTMSAEADPFSVSPGTQRDPRITRVGRWLRMSGLDELPQLLNVLKGEMSLVGPRPEMPFLVEGYSELERSRLAVKPGITGLWQLSPDRDAQIHDNLEYDIYYTRNQSLLLDILVLAETVIFTISLVIRRLAEPLRTLVHRRSPAEVESATEVSLGGYSSYMLLALDQRVRGGEGRYWRRCLEAVRSTAGTSTVKVLVAPGNLAAMAGMLEPNKADCEVMQVPSDLPSNGDPGSDTSIELVPYRGSGDLSDWAEDAQVVVTDLSYVRDRLVPDESSAVVFLDDEGCIVAEGSNTGSVNTVIDSLVKALQSTNADDPSEQ